MRALLAAALALAAGCAFDFEQPGLLRDDTFADFAAGSLSEGGAKIYVSAQGNVQLLDRLDVDGDGEPDVVFTNHVSNGSWELSSYVYTDGANRFTGKQHIELPTVGAMASASADLNADGFVDLLFTNHKRSNDDFQVDSYIYWGGAGGFSEEHRLGLASPGAGGPTVADLDHDGYLDIAIAANFDGKKYHDQSWIYYGHAAGFRLETLPAMGAAGATAADVDGDGFLDLLFCNFATGTFGPDTDRRVPSYLYWGSTSGYSATSRTDLAAVGAIDGAVADLDGDGQLDIVLAANGDVDTDASYVYFGAGSRTFSSKVTLPTRRAYAVSVADLDGDGQLDVVFANYGDASDTEHFAQIYWGPWTRSYASPPTELPACRATGNQIADLDRDGALDLVLSCKDDSASLVFWGPWTGQQVPTGPPTSLPTTDAYLSTVADPGAVSDRGHSQHLVSRVLDAGGDQVEYVTLRFEGIVPPHTSVALQLRSAASAAALEQAPWRGPTSTGDRYTSSPAKIDGEAHRDQRYIQYRATLTSDDFATTPILERVEITYASR